MRNRTTQRLKEINLSRILIILFEVVIMDL